MADPVVIIIVTHARPDLLRRTLLSLRAADYPRDRCELLILENGGLASTVELTQEFADLRVVVEVVNSPAKVVALNRALELRPNAWHLYLDDDVRVAPDLIKIYLAEFDRAGPGWYYGGPTAVDRPVDHTSTTADWLLPFLPASARGFSLTGGATTSDKITSFLGFNWAAHAHDLVRAGRYPLGVGPGTPLGAGDETIMQWRLVQAGVRSRYLPDPQVWHYVPPERCSAAWCLRRARGGGATAAVFAEHYARNQFLGRPRAILRNARKALQRVNWLSLVCMRPGGLYSLRWSLAWISGFIAGYGAAKVDN